MNSWLETNGNTTLADKHHDDRLATALAVRVGSEGAARIQYRQLVDLLGTVPADADSPQIDAGFVRLGELSSRIGARERAAILMTPGLRLRSPRLVAVLASGAPAVAEAAIRAAQLDEDQWLDIIPALPLPARGIMRVRRDLGPRAEELLARLGIARESLPAGEATALSTPKVAIAPDMDEPAPAPAIPLAQAESSDLVAPAPLAPAPLQSVPLQPVPDQASGRIEGIGAIVRRIEAFRKAREAEKTATQAPREDPLLPLDVFTAAPANAPRVLDFVSDAGHRVSWSEEATAPMLVGLNLVALPPLTAPLRARQPLRGVRVTLRGSPVIAGDWLVDALPEFHEPGGRFAGYVGRMRRAPAPANDVLPADSQNDRLRQVLHELRTPVNAVQGFAEIIQQQLFGPAPHRYRALAAAIAGDAAHVLAGLEELERLAKLRSGALALPAGHADLAQVLDAVVARLRPQAEARAIAIETEWPMPGIGGLAVAMAPVEAERLAWRTLAAWLAGTADEARFTVAAAVSGGRAQVTIARSRSRSGADLATGEDGASPSIFGSEFALRLAASEARAAGGHLEIGQKPEFVGHSDTSRQEMVNLSLPVLTASMGIPSHAPGAERSHG